MFESSGGVKLTYFFTNPSQAQHQSSYWSILSIVRHDWNWNNLKYTLAFSDFILTPFKLALLSKITAPFSQHERTVFSLFLTVRQAYLTAALSRALPDGEQNPLVEIHGVSCCEGKQLPALSCKQLTCIPQHTALILLLNVFILSNAAADILITHILPPRPPFSPSSFKFVT